MKKGMHYGMGMMSVFMIFVVLTFTMLSVISFINGMDENTVSIKQASYVKEFYQADAKAKVIMSRLDHYLDMNELATLLSEHNIEKKEDTYHYSVDVNEKVILEVGLFDSGDEMEITQWVTKSK